ncbi:MAG: hypothetical protein NTX63_02295 [Candidatus Peregrinibacteria bacterium]|nr:hypothetical protein [Candidatus Peregrinibacteria bacterium]
MDNLPVVPVTSVSSAPVAAVAVASSMKTAIIAASLVVVLGGAGVGAWLYTSPNASKNIAALTADEQSSTPPSLQQVKSGLQGSFTGNDTLNNCRQVTAADVAAWPAKEAKLKADNVPHMQLGSGLQFGIATRDTKLSEIEVSPEAKCVITAVYDDGKWYLDPDPKGMFGNATVTITDPSTFIIKKGYGVVMFVQKPGATLYGLVDSGTALAEPPVFDENAHGWFLTGETSKGDFLKSVLPRNPNSWIYDLTAPGAASGLVFSKIPEPTTQKFDKVFLMWTRLGVKGGGGVTEGETPVPVVTPVPATTKDAVTEQKNPEPTASNVATTVDTTATTTVSDTPAETPVVRTETTPTEPTTTPAPTETRDVLPTTTSDACPTGEFMATTVSDAGVTTKACLPVLPIPGGTKTPTQTPPPPPATDTTTPPRRTETTTTTRTTTPTTALTPEQQRELDARRAAATTNTTTTVTPTTTHTSTTTTTTTLTPEQQLAARLEATRLAAGGGATTTTTTQTTVTKPKLIILP